MRLTRNLAFAALLGAVFPFQSANAVTQCDVHISRIFSGDSGMIWFFYAEGGASILGATDPDREATLTMAMTALVAGRTVTVRYTANGVACTDTRSDLEGFFLN